MTRPERFAVSLISMLYVLSALTLLGGSDVLRGRA